MFQDMFAQRLMDNTFRGIWCEYMVAEALGPDCKNVGAGWHPWDLQIGDSTARYPDRIRLQAKNSARLQFFNAVKKKGSKCEFNLVIRKRPFYFEENNPDGVYCEDFGFLCEAYVLCLHDETDWDRADHGDPSQWKFFVLPLVAPNARLTRREIECLESKRPLTRRLRPEVWTLEPLRINERLHVDDLVVWPDVAALMPVCHFCIQQPGVSKMCWLKQMSGVSSVSSGSKPAAPMHASM